MVKELIKNEKIVESLENKEISIKDLKEFYIQEILSSEKEESPILDVFLDKISQEESYRDAMFKYYSGFFSMSFKIKPDLANQLQDIMNMYQFRNFFLEIAKEIGAENEFIFYEQELKYLFKLNKQNAIAILKNIVDSSQDIINDNFEEINELIKNLNS